MRRREFDAEALSNVDQISQFQWSHLRKDLMSCFYFSLLCVSASSTLGAYFTEYIGSSFGLFGALASFYCFYLTPPWHEQKKRVCLISLVACFGWAFVNPWLTYILSVDAGFTVTLLLATCVGFGCYWVSSIRTGIFGWVYFRAMCLCTPLVLACLYICSSVFGGDSAHWKYQLYTLVLWYMVYVAAYSQFVIFKARGGENDYVMHAICLFVFCPDLVMVSMKMMKEMYRRR
ncbi:hypothetical protein CASFOL_006153 [Castilleja foliolosa]|uniref:Bax inhibitor 1 n=1 Tax=Castilleja foliolosa TaxID=1961234 RepID=A0ABD3E9G6_9LAMI